MEFRNDSTNKFVDISSEAYRTYLYLGKGVVRIDNPLQLSISKSGGHRVFDADGNSHYIAPGWQQITWKARDGQPNFVK